MAESRAQPTLETLRAIVDGTASVVGGDFFQELVRHLVRCAEVPIAFVCEIADADRTRARTCALRVEGEPQPNFEYALEGTPCEGVVARQVCFYPDRVNELFPDDAWLGEVGARTYVGVPFFDSRGEPLGHLGVIDTRPRRDSEHLRTVLEVFANRAAAELERMRIDDELARSYARLKEANLELERRVDERTAELQTALDRTRAALQLREDFIRAASHELATPITSVQLSARRLARRVDRFEARDRTDIERLGRQIDRLRVLTNQMLDGIRLHAGRDVSLKPKRVDLVEVVRRVLDALELDRARSGSELTLHATSPVVGCWDESRLEQVVTNLIANALKYGEGAPIEVEARSDSDHAVLRVLDRGIGIPAGDIHRVFAPFARAAPVQRYGGLGLGLYISREIVEQHGGRISVHSVEGEGTTFVVELPRGEVS